VVNVAGVNVACGRTGVVVNAHIPQHEGRGKEVVMDCHTGDLVMISHMSFN